MNGGGYWWDIKNLGFQYKSVYNLDNKPNNMHNFKVDKGTQSLNYFAVKEGGKINKMKAIKLLWAADRYHIRKYGRSVTDDNYLAMPYGPVGSVAKDIAQNSDFCTDEVKKYAQKYIERTGKYEYKSSSKVDFDALSESDLEALKFAYDIFGKFDQFQLAKISHAYPEWKIHKGAGQMNIPEMSYLDFFADPDLADPNLKLLSNKDPFKESSDSLMKNEDVYKSNKDIERLLY